MLWVIYSLLSALLFTSSNILDKLVLEKWIKKPIVSALFFALFEVAAGIIVYIYHGFSGISASNAALALFTGFISFLATILYFEAVKVEEISRVVPFFYLSPIYIMIFGFFFLSERFPAKTYIGVFLVVFGAFLISMKKGVGLRFQKPHLFLIFASILIAVSSAITKHLLDSIDFWTMFGYSRVGMIFLLVPLVFLNRDNILFEFKHNSSKIILPMFLSEFFTLLGIAFMFIAYTSGFVTLVSALLTLQTLFLFAITILFTIFFPKVLSEGLSTRIFLQKGIAIIVMIIGSILII